MSRKLKNNKERYKKYQIINTISKGTQRILLKTIVPMKQILIYFFGEKEKVVNKMVKPALPVLIKAILFPANEEEFVDPNNVHNL